MTDQPAVNPWEAKGRAEKAFRIAQFLVKHNITAELVENGTDADWATAARLAGYAKPPSELTRGMVIDHLRKFAEQ